MLQSAMQSLSGVFESRSSAAARCILTAIPASTVSSQNDVLLLKKKLENKTAHPKRSCVVDGGFRDSAAESLLPLKPHNENNYFNNVLKLTMETHRHVAFGCRKLQCISVSLEGRNAQNSYFQRKYTKEKS